MAYPITPSPSSRSANTIDLTTDDDGDIIAKNRMLILELEQKYILPQGILSITPTGQLEADLSREEPDQGTMRGLYPTEPYDEAQIPSWLRDYLIKELNLFGRGPPSACGSLGSLYDQMLTSREVDNEGKNLSVKSAALLLSCGTTSLRHSIENLREFCSSGEAVCEDSYAMEFGIVEGVVKRLAGWDASQSVQKRLLATRRTDAENDEQSPAKRRKISEDTAVGVAHGATAASSQLPKDIHLLLDLGSQGMIMKGILDSSLEDLIITPICQLIDKLEMVHKGLQNQEKEEKMKENLLGGDHSSDSGVSACSP